MPSARNRVRASMSHSPFFFTRRTNWMTRRRGISREPFVILPVRLAGCGAINSVKFGWTIGMGFREKSPSLASWCTDTEHIYIGTGQMCTAICILSLKTLTHTEREKDSATGRKKKWWVILSVRLPVVINITFLYFLFSSVFNRHGPCYVCAARQVANEFIKYALDWISRMGHKEWEAEMLPKW